jgi:hypothetical protein
MSDFLERALSGPVPVPKKVPITPPEPVPATRGPNRKSGRRHGPGLTGSARRYAAMLTVMAGLTAVPTWVILKTGVTGLSTEAVAPVSPLIVPLPPVAPVSPEPAQQDPAPHMDEAEPPQAARTQTAPAPAPAITPPREEHTAIVDTPDRPVRKKKASPPAESPKPKPPKASTTKPEPPKAEVPPVTPAPPAVPAIPVAPPAATPTAVVVPPIGWDRPSTWDGPGLWECDPGAFVVGEHAPDWLDHVPQGDLVDFLLK